MKPVNSLLFSLLVSLAVCLMAACSDSDSNGEGTLAGSWFISEDNEILVLGISGDGSGAISTHAYDGEEWKTETFSLHYTLTDNLISVQLQGGQAWSGILAITGKSMSITTENEVYMFTRLEAGQLNKLKADIEENWLELEPIPVLPEENAGIDKQQVEALINGLYVSLSEFEVNQLNLENIRLTGYDWRQNRTFISPYSQEVSDTWTYGYTVVNRANLLIERLQDVSISGLSEREIAFYREEALAIRCLVYYNMAHLWNQVVYFEKVPEENNIVDAPVYTFEELLPVLRSSLASISSLHEQDYHIDMETVSALSGELALWENKDDALYYLGACNADFSVPVAAYEQDWYNWLGEEIPNYTATTLDLLRREAYGETDGLVEAWKAAGSPLWGYWAMLKRTGHAVEEAGCEAYEQLMPIPQEALMYSPALSQNPGYLN